MKAVIVIQPASANSFETLANVSSVRLNKLMFAAPSYLSNSSDVFDSGFVVEAKVLVQSEANVIPIEAVGKFLFVQKMLFESTGDGGLRYAEAQIGLMNGGRRRPDDEAATHLSAPTQAS